MLHMTQSTEKMPQQTYRDTERCRFLLSVPLGLCACIILLTLVHSACAAPLTANSSIDDVLEALDAAGVGLHDFTANVTLTEEDAAAGDSTTRAGTVYYQKNSDGSARIHVIFDTQTADGATSKQKVEYLLADDWLTDRDYIRKTEIRRQILRPGEKINPLKLGEGPFPLPIGQSKEEVYKEFTVTKPAPAKDDVPDSLHLQLTPKSGSQFADKFASIDVYIDLKTGFPVRIVTIDDNQTIIRTTNLQVLSRNAGLSDKDFQLSSIGGDWNRRVEPFEQ
jgi:outer membrane lipoprotein-sorting protein